MRLLVVDGNSIVNRAFYAIKLLSTKGGQFTNAIYGFLNVLLKLEEECRPDHVAVAFDLKAPTFRHKMYAGYKAGRKAMPPELASQLPILKKLLSALGYTIIEKEGFEADDILGTLSARVKGDDRCFLATGDRDSLQLISDNTVVLLASTKMGKPQTVLFNKEKLMEEYGVEPQGMIEIKALMGDSSDKIPGVAGIGQKTAEDLINRFKTIDNIYSNLDTLDIKKSVRSKLESGKESAYLSKTLGTICTDAPIETDMTFYEKKEPNAKEAITMLVSLEMFSMIEKLGLTREGACVPSEEKAPERRLSFKEERDLCGLLGEFKNAGEAFFVCEYENHAVKAFFFSIGDEIRLVESNCFDFDSFTKSFFEGEWKKYTCDSKLLYRYAENIKAKLFGLAFDSTLAGYILNPSANSYEILRLADTLGVFVPSVDCPENLKKYVQSAAALRGVFEKSIAEIKENDQEYLLYEIEQPLAKVLASMESTGFLVDRDEIARYGKEIEKKVNELSEKIFSLVGFEFNLNSPKQLGEALFEKMGIPPKKKTKSGYSTSAEVLESLSYDYPVVADILKYRMLAKIKSTYCDGLLKQIDADGRIRSTLNQTETKTGRISSLEPNLQNIPVRYKEGREIRRFFTAGEGRVLVDADYSQIELRVLAAIADDEAMISAFENGDDIHAITASQVFNMPLSMVTPLMRSRAKAVNFGIVYGIGAFSLAKDIGVTLKEASSYIKGYLHHYSGIDRYMKQVAEKAREDGFAQTLFHRRRYLPELTAANKTLQAFGERVARNMPVQGTAADIIKIAMVKVFESLSEKTKSAKLIMQVHDELIVECDEAEKETVCALLKEEMENACKMRVKLLAEVHTGKTWYDAKD